MKGRFAFRKEGEDFILISADRMEYRIPPGHHKYGWLTKVEAGKVISINKRWRDGVDRIGLYTALAGEQTGFVKPETVKKPRMKSTASKNRTGKAKVKRLTKRSVLFRQFRKFTRKSQEAYVVSRIWHRLDCDDVEMITQQYVKRPGGGYALTDAYFPQFNVHIEVQEDAHQNHVEADKARKQDIVEVTRDNVILIWPGDSQDDEASLEKLHQQIEEVVADFHNRRAEMMADGTWKPWDDPGYEFSIERWRREGEVSLSKGGALRTIWQVCNAFGHQYSGLQKAWASNPMDPKTGLWFPKLYTNNDWDNQLLDNGQWIREEYIGKDTSGADEHAETVANRGKDRVTFAHVTSPLGVTLYRFVGVFRMEVDRCEPQKGVWWYKRVATSAKTAPWPED